MLRFIILALAATCMTTACFGKEPGEPKQDVPVATEQPTPRPRGGAFGIIDWEEQNRQGDNHLIREGNLFVVLHNGAAGRAAAVSTETGEWAELRFPADSAEKKYFPISTETYAVYDLGDELAAFSPYTGEWAKVSLDAQRDPSKHFVSLSKTYATLMTPEAVYFFAPKIGKWQVQKLFQAADAGSE